MGIMSDSDSMSMQPLTGVKTDRDRYGDMLEALEVGDENALKEAVSHLNASDLNRSFTHAADDVFSISKNTLPLPVQEDLSQKDMVRIYPVHYAAMNGDKSCLQILLDGGADPNIKDSFGQTPLHILPKRGWKNTSKDYEGCLDVLLNNGSIKCNRLDLSRSTPYFRAEDYQWSYMTQRLRERGCIKDYSVEGAKEETSSSELLLNYLLEQNFEQFKNALIIMKASGAGIESIANESHGSYTLLQYSCRCGRLDFVSELLMQRAAPILKDEVNILSPVMWATKFGYHKIVQKLIQCMTTEDLKNGALREESDMMETPLHHVVMCENKHNGEEVNYYRCLRLLLDKKGFLDIDARNADGNTPLHFAAICHDFSGFSTLLKNGANSTVKNVIGLCAMHYINKEGMMTVLDECIEFDNRKKLVDSDFWIALNFNMMNIQDTSQQGIKANTKGQMNTEMDFLNMLTDIHKDKDILYHPVLEVFMYLKWQNIKKYFLVNFAFHIIFLILLIAYISVYHRSLPTSCGRASETCSSDQEDDLVRTSFIVVLLVTLFLREVIQIFMTKLQRDLMFDMKSLAEVFTVVFTLLLLCFPFNASVLMGISAWLIIFSLLEFIFLLGQLPKFSVYIAMFNAVAWNFFKFICLFSVIIVAFSFSFYLMFQISEEFRTFPESLVKTIVMITGDVGYSDLPIASFPVASHIAMVFFVFLMLLVLMNLLNGLAISDIQAVQNKAEVISCMSLINRISQLEKAFYCLNSRNPFKKMLDWLFGNTLTFRSCVPDHRLVIYVSRHAIQYKLRDGLEDLSLCICHSHKLQESHIVALKRNVMERRKMKSPE